MLGRFEALQKLQAAGMPMAPPCADGMPTAQSANEGAIAIWARV